MIRANYTIKREKEIFTTHILSYFGEMKIKDITPLTIREWQNKKAKNIKILSFFNNPVFTRLTIYFLKIFQLNF